jgi:hypothetical protein
MGQGDRATVVVSTQHSCHQHLYRRLGIRRQRMCWTSGCRLAERDMRKTRNLERVPIPSNRNRFSPVPTPSRWQRAPRQNQLAQCGDGWSEMRFPICQASDHEYVAYSGCVFRRRTIVERRCQLEAERAKPDMVERARLDKIYPMPVMHRTGPMTTPRPPCD